MAMAAPASAPPRAERIQLLVFFIIVRFFEMTPFEVQTPSQISGEDGRKILPLQP